ncbi:amino acid adenylation domain-containing protein [Streptomyces sp. WMMB 714]|uniref:AMP-binding protein n=1 Tax=Streptomyces sp. WMMB 714 TaxID=1286822 RepID=UPI0005F7C734|nr:AMP-binding protein [Streptomyces sp. WMMB 714]SCK51270.1 amino acid adenylation domain-containing protein [Streptomyces sp. WMMB 714]
MSTASEEALHTTVSRWAAARPDATAVVHGARTTSYAELDRTADAWAAELTSRGVGRGDLVPVLLPRGTELVAAVLAVLKCGAAYALLDPAWPDRRIQEVTGQLSARLIVTDAPGARHAGLPAWSPAACGGTGEPAGFRPAGVGADAPACVFFTSGTTGRPKGVLTPHRATARLVRPGTFARFAPSTVIPLAAALPWDAFSLELWGALLGGGTCLVVDEPYLSAQGLREAVAVHGADTVWLTSSLLNMIVDEDPDAFRGLRQVMTGGERLSVPHVRAFLRRHPGIALVNGYGPVESTVFATTHRVTEPDCDLPGGIPVGRPVPGTEVHLVDGEICVAGDGLALRYLGEPALTEAAFPRITVGGREVRVYRTGDLGELDEDGVLHYRGRADRQVKIRGHRIEPAEVERQIEALLPDVRACRVVATRDAGGNATGLLAFCVPAVPGESPHGAEEKLRTELVHYQRPDAVVAVPAFPVTPNGKLDEQALLDLAPPAVPTAAAAPEALLSPAGETDEPLVELAAAVFAAVLGVASVPSGTAFTDLGGTSLGAGRVCARLAAELGRPVPLSRLYEHPTARALGQWLALTGGTPTPAAAEGGDVPLSPMQAGYLTSHLLRPEDRSAHCLLLFRIDGELDLDALDAAVEAVHERHEVLRTAYRAAPRPLARPAGLPAPVLEIMDTAPDADTAVEELSESLGAPLELADGEVWRTALVPLDSGSSWIFGCVVHHIAFDGWSESVLAAHLAEAYDAAAGGTPPAVPFTAPTAAETARLRRDRLAHADPAAQRAALEAELTGVPELVWPAAPCPADVGRRPQRIERVLDADAAARVDAAAAGAGTTRYAVLLACYGQVLAEVTGGRDFAVGTPVAQRSDSRLDEAVGCHIEMACLRLRGDVLDGGPDSFAAAARIVDRAFRAQDVAFHDLVRLLNPPRTGRPPVFQTLLVLQDNALPQLPLTGLTTTHLRPPYLDIPLEVQTEFWPLPCGRLRLAVNYRTDAVRSTTAHELTKRLADLVHTLPLPEGEPS